MTKPEHSPEPTESMRMCVPGDCIYARALIGLNPEGVRPLVEAATRIGNSTRHCNGRPMPCDMVALRAALALLEGRTDATE